PLLQERLIAGVEGIEPIEAERRGAPELDGAQGGARPALGAQVPVDEREAVAPRDRRTQRRVDDLMARQGRRAGRERGDAGQEAVVAGSDVARGRNLAHDPGRYHVFAPDAGPLTLSNRQLLMPAQGGCRSLRPGGSHASEWNDARR